MIVSAMRSQLLRPLGRTFWVVLLVGAGLLPLLHAAHHLDSTTYCTVCHFARGGVPALLRAPVTLAPGAIAVRVPVAIPEIQHERPTFRGEIIRGPPVSSLA
jgi:hypothetical protein